MATAHRTERLAAVIVAYNPAGDFAPRFLATAAQFDHVWIVDNADMRNHESFSLLEKSNITHVLSGSNAGVASGQNTGVERAADEGFLWVVLLDQDTELPPNFGVVAREAIARESGDPAVAMFAPAYNDNGTIHGKSSGAYMPVKLAIASGSLVRVESYRCVGGMDSKLFIDYVDYDFCFKLAIQNKKLLSLPVTVRHTVGKLSRHRFLFWSVTTSHHEARRLFSAGRNLTIMSGRYWRREPVCISLFWAFELRRLFFLSFFESQALHKVRAFLSGVWEAIRHGDRHDLAQCAMWSRGAELRRT